MNSIGARITAGDFQLSQASLRQQPALQHWLAALRRDMSQGGLALDIQEVADRYWRDVAEHPHRRWISKEHWRNVKPSTTNTIAMEWVAGKKGLIPYLGRVGVLVETVAFDERLREWDPTSAGAAAQLARVGGIIEQMQHEKKLAETYDQPGEELLRFTMPWWGLYTVARHELAPPDALEAWMHLHREQVGWLYQLTVVFADPDDLRKPIQGPVLRTTAGVQRDGQLLQGREGTVMTIENLVGLDNNMVGALVTSTFNPTWLALQALATGIRNREWELDRPHFSMKKQRKFADETGFNPPFHARLLPRRR